MVTPVWAEFPGDVRPGWTSIHLSLSITFEEANLVQELRTFDANLLIFLRHVKEINICMAGGVGHKENKITKDEIQKGLDRIITLSSDHGTS
jgi:hypothetical protein